MPNGSARRIGPGSTRGFVGFSGPAKRRRTRRHGETRAGAGRSKISTPSPAMPLNARPGSGRAASVRQSSAPRGSEKQKAPATEPRRPNDREVWACDIPRRTLAGPIWRRAEVESSRPEFLADQDCVSLHQGDLVQIADASFHQSCAIDARALAWRRRIGQRLDDAIAGRFCRDLSAWRDTLREPSDPRVRTGI